VLCLIVRAGAERVAIQAASILEVVPAVQLHLPAGAPGWIAGVFRFRGAVTPVIDLHQLAVGGPCPVRLSSRIVVVEYPTIGGPRPLGLLAERTTDLAEVTPTGPGYMPAMNGNVPDLGPLITDSEGMLRLATVGRLVPSDYRDRLFGQGDAYGSGGIK
jgi:chemotaxis-related protein WspB